MSHARLLDIAIREFGAKGLEGASTRGIAAAAGTAMSAITYHFGGKEGLYRAAASHIAETMGAEFVTVLAECEAAPAGPEAARTCVHRLLDHFAAKLIGDDHADWSLFIMREQMEPTAAFDCFYDGPMGRMMQRLAVHVAVATGVADGAARIAALTMFGQVVVFRASRALTLRLMQIDALDDRIAQELRRRIGANTDAILDQMTAERQEAAMSDQDSRDDDDAKTPAGGKSSDEGDEQHKESGKKDDAGGKSGDKDGDGDDEDGDGDGGDEDSDAKDEDKTPIYKKPLFWIILIVVVLAIAIGGTLYYLHARQYVSTDDAFVDAHIVRVAPQVGGTLVSVASVDNRHVEPGTLLATVQQTGPQASLSEAEANVKQALAQVEQARAQVASAIADRNQAASQALSPLATAAKAAEDLSRYQALVRLDRTAVAPQQVDQARATFKSNAAQAAAARRAVSSADAQVEVARRQVKAAQAVVDARLAQVRSARVTLGNAELRAPIAGQVVNRSVNLGSYVGPGTQLMAIIPDTMWITANFKETQLTLMRIGQPVAITVDAFPDVTFEGHVDSIQRGAGQAFALLPAQNATGNYVKVVQRVPVRITFDLQHGPDPRRYPIGPGMSVVPTVKVR